MAWIERLAVASQAWYHAGADYLRRLREQGEENAPDLRCACVQESLSSWTCQWRASYCRRSWITWMEL